MFGFGKKKNDKSKSCCCGANCTSESVEQAVQRMTGTGIKVLGGGCVKCHELEENTKEALTELKMDKTVELITDFTVIATYGVMSTPALVIDNKVVSYGKVLKTHEIVQILRKGSV